MRITANGRWDTAVSINVEMMDALKRQKNGVVQLSDSVNFINLNKTCLLCAFCMSRATKAFIEKDATHLNIYGFKTTVESEKC